jgi:hypothetical protein
MKFIGKPQNIFLLDGLGAFLTAIILFFFKLYFGIPIKIMSILAIIALIFSMYSLVCFLLKPHNWQSFLKGISIANLLYCVLTFTLLISYWGSVTTLGIIYFFVEIIIISVLVYMEIKIVRTINESKIK